MPDYIKSRQIYQGMTSCWDEMLGNITKKLKEKGLWNNTLIVLSSDNGGPEGQFYYIYIYILFIYYLQVPQITFL